MPKHDLDACIQEMTAIVAERLTNAAALAKSAAMCCAEGNARAAVDIALGIDQPLYEATTLLNAMSLLNRIARD